MNIKLITNFQVEKKIARYYVALLMGLVLFFVSGFARAEEEPIIYVEESKVSTKAVMNIDVGDTSRIIMLNPKTNEMYISFSINVDVNAFVVSYSRHTKVDAWFDARGIKSFVSEIDENGKKTLLNGKREMLIREREMMHVKGHIKNEKIDKSYPFSLIQYTNVENFPYISALAKQSITWRILCLFDGELKIEKTIPLGLEKCPEPLIGNCYKVHRKSRTLNAIAYYTPEGMMAGADGNDAQGYFRLTRKKPEPRLIERKQDGGLGGFLKGVWGASDSDKKTN